jgi:mono/diheme cytochrome c family protein
MDKEETLYPSPTDCGKGVTYTKDIKPIIDANCVSCHSTTIAKSAGGGNILDTYEGAKSQAVSGTLFNVVNHTAGSSKMPKSANKLNDCSIVKIKTWVDAGAPNN